MTTAAPAQPVFFIQHPSGVRYLIRAITSSTQEVVFNHLGYEVGTPVDPRPFLYWAKLPAGSRLQITSDGETEAATFSLVLEALSS